MIIRAEISFVGYNPLKWYWKQNEARLHYRRMHQTSPGVVVGYGTQNKKDITGSVNR